MATSWCTLLPFLFILLSFFLLKGQASNIQHGSWQHRVKQDEEKARAKDKHNLAPWEHAKRHQDTHMKERHGRQGPHPQPLLPPKLKSNFKPGPWQQAHATFYGGSNAEGANSGACGYGDMKSHGYGYETVAINEGMFDKGFTCGACYEIKCVDEQKWGKKSWCKPGNSSLFVTAVNMGPPPGTFDLTEPVFGSIADYEAGNIQIQQRRVPCHKRGGIRFTITGSPYYTMVLVWNVAGAGDVRSLKVKGDKNVPWTEMQRDWGQIWKTSAMLVGESLTFRVETSDGKRSTSWHITPKNWQHGQTYEGKNFR